MVDNPFAGATRLSGAPAPLSIEQAKADIVKAPIQETKTTEVKVGRENESPLQYVQRILKEHDGLESNIPVGHDYWEIKRRV